MSSRISTSSTPQVPPTPGAFPSTSGESDSDSAVIVSTQLSLSQAVHKRKAEFTRSRKLRIKIGTWNVAALTGTEKDIGDWFVDGKVVSDSRSGFAILSNDQKGQVECERPENKISQKDRRSKKESTIPKHDINVASGGDEIGIYVLGLQEIVDISSAAEALRIYSDPLPGNKWKRAVAEALPQGYELVAEQQLMGLFLVIYASSQIAPTISSVSTTSVATGLWGVVGNKGAVVARIVLGETTRIVLINCHLTAGTEKDSLDRRNWNASDILRRTKFDPIEDGGGIMEECSEGIGDEDFAFWFGDLNYRLESMPGEDVRRLLMLHTQKQYDIVQSSEPKIDDEPINNKSSENARSGGGRKSYQGDDGLFTTPDKSGRSCSTLSTPDTENSLSDPASLQTMLSSLLPHDELRMQMRMRKAFHDGWREGPIHFLPTYKYDVGSVGVFDSSEKRRGPSWCDRILYRTRKDRVDYQNKIWQEEEAKRRDEEMKTRGVDESVDEDEDMFFDYDPETDGAQEVYDEDDADFPNSDAVTTKSGLEDKLELDYYISHQRVLSSDHKPLDAVFTLTYDAVDPELKAKVQQEVARELDKAENEGRPAVTVVVDNHDPCADDKNNSGMKNPKFEGVDFGEVRYDCENTKTITIANTGRVPATVGFVDRSDDRGQPSGVAPPWLSIHFDRTNDSENSNLNTPPVFTLEPGDATNVELTLRVRDFTHVRQLNEGSEGLEDVLVLRIQNGRDYFLPLRGIWIQSAFGRSIETLIRVPDSGVRGLQHSPWSRKSYENEGVKWSAPKEIFRLTETIEELTERSVAEWEMRGEQENPPWDNVEWPFVKRTGEDLETETLKEIFRESLDTNRDFSALCPLEARSLQRLEAAAATLLTFLESLQDGVITAELWSVIEQGMLDHEKNKVLLTSEEERNWILEVLSSASAHSTSFTFITFMLSRVADGIVPVRSTNPNLILSPTGTRTTREGKQIQQMRRRREVDAAYAKIFAPIIIRAYQLVNEKERKAGEARRTAMMEVVLRAWWEDTV